MQLSRLFIPVILIVLGSVCLRAGAADVPNLPMTDIVYANQEKFQILHCGIDGAWGDFLGTMDLLTVGNPSIILRFPEGPFIDELSDTLSNFTQTTLEDAQP